jgi:hypothetical protein
MSSPHFRFRLLVSLTALVAAACSTRDDPRLPNTGLPYAIVDTGQTDCYSDTTDLPCPELGDAFWGQDGVYTGHAPSFLDNEDGTVLDRVTGLTWTQARYGKMSWNEAVTRADDFALAGYDDWRLPTIQELYSLIDFRGGFHLTEAASTPYIDTDHFEFAYGDEGAGERLIDVQVWSATEYVSTTMMGDATTFGVNFADGRIKGYPQSLPPPMGGGDNQLFVRYVRGNTDYGLNEFVDHEDGTVSDLATGLQWQQNDDGVPRDWEGALAHCESLELAGFEDWRLPNAKELHSIVDYSRSPTTSGSAAIDPVFGVMNLEPYFWTSTTHLDGEPSTLGRWAVYLCFGRAMGLMESPPGSGELQPLDVHGAGAQRSDPKSGDPSQWPEGNGPQGDDVRIFHAVRCVRG